MQNFMCVKNLKRFSVTHSYTDKIHLVGNNKAMMDGDVEKHERRL